MLSNLNKLKLKFKPTTSKLKLIDLFAGTGAFSHSFESTGQVRTVFANDILKESSDIYNLNHPISLTLKDLNDINVAQIPPHDILTGGFPCQPFSIAGLKQGFNDPRSNVFFKIMDIIEHHKPRFAILENVKNLKSHDNGETFKVIQSKIKDIGYHLKYMFLNTCEITDIPQNRERIYIVCFRDLGDYDRFDTNFANIKNRQIKEFLESNVDDKYYYNERFKNWDIIKDGVTKHIDTNVVYQFRRKYIRENKSSVCPTLTANGGTGGNNVPLIRDNKGIRKLTPRECFNLQGFPQNYVLPKLSDNHLYKLAGNAISVPVVKILADKIIELI